MARLGHDNSREWFWFVSGVMEGMLFRRPDATAEKIAEDLKEWGIEEAQGLKLATLHKDVLKRNPEMHRWDRCATAWAEWQTRAEIEN